MRLGGGGVTSTTPGLAGLKLGLAGDYPVGLAGLLGSGGVGLPGLYIGLASTLIFFAPP